MFIHEDLTEEIKKKNVVLFVGAGVSMNLGLPSWGQLIDEMASELGVDKDEFQNSGDFLELAEYYKLKKGSIGPLRSWMDVNFHSSEIKIENSDVFKLLIELDFPIIYTTNYDRWLEKAYDHYKKPYVKITNIFDLTKISSQETQIIKFHGDFDNDDTIVLSESSYFERLALDGPLDMKLRSDTMGKSILFLGYSLSDINIRYMLFKLNQLWDNSSHQSIKPKSYIFMLKQNKVKKTVFNNRGIETIVSDEKDPANALSGFLTKLVKYSKED